LARRGQPEKENLNRASFLSDDAERARVLLNVSRRNMTGDQRRALVAELNRRDWSQQEIAEALGVARTTITGDISIVKSDNAYINDRRTKLTPTDKAEIVERVLAGETQAQVAADKGVEQPRVSQILKQAPLSENPTKYRGPRYLCQPLQTIHPLGAPRQTHQTCHTKKGTHRSGRVGQIRQFVRFRPDPSGRAWPAAGPQTGPKPAPLGARGQIGNLSVFALTPLSARGAP